jgi:hypothetical protein
MAGYKGYSMSNNAAAAYEDGEKPLSAWTKAEILAAIESADLDRKFDLEKLMRLTVGELRLHGLYKSSWHHTSSRYNRTNFHSLDLTFFEDLTDEKIDEIIQTRQPKAKKAKAEPRKIKAKIRYTQWEGQYARYRKAVDYTEEVTFFENDKMIRTQNGNKRLSSVTILSKEFIV